MDDRTTSRDTEWTPLDADYFRRQVREGLTTFFRPWSVVDDDQHDLFGERRKRK